VVLLAAQPVSFGLNLLATVLLSRALTPADFGLVLMCTAITNFALTFRDFGLGTVTIVRKDLTRQQISNLFWLNTGAGLLLTATFWVGSKAIAWLYGDARLVAITLASSLVFAITGLGVQHTAMLRRQMRFGALALVDLLALAFAGALGVGLAWVTHSYWALVAFNVARPSVVLIGIWLIGSWWPATFRRGAGTMDLVSRGLNVAGFDVVNYWSRNCDNLLVGGVLGADALGLYKKGYDLLLLPITQLRAPIAAVSLPALSRHQAQPAALASRFLEVVGVIVFASTAAVAILALLADWLIPFVLGTQWNEAASIFKRLAPAGVAQSAVGPLGLLLISSDRTRQYLKWGIAHASTMVLSFFLGIRFGLDGLIDTYVGANLLAFLPSVWYCTAGTRVSVKAFLVRVMVPIAVCGSAYAIVVIVFGYMVDLPKVAQMVARTVMFVALIGVVAWWRRHDYRILGILVRSALSMLSTRWGRPTLTRAR
jgi:O-antigen/teichoic acid export membrane protein